MASAEGLHGENDDHETAAAPRSIARRFVHRWYPVLLICAIYATAVTLGIRTFVGWSSINIHETGYAYYPAVLASQVRAALHEGTFRREAAALARHPRESWRAFQDGAREHYRNYAPYGVLIAYLGLFLATGKSVTAMRFLYLAIDLVVLLAWYGIATRTLKGRRYPRATAAAACVLLATFPLFLRNLFIPNQCEQRFEILPFTFALWAYTRHEVGKRPGALLPALFCALTSFVKPHSGAVLATIFAIHRLADGRRLIRAEARWIATFAGAYLALLFALVIGPSVSGVPFLGQFGGSMPGAEPRLDHFPGLGWLTRSIVLGMSNLRLGTVVRQVLDATLYPGFAVVLFAAAPPSLLRRRAPDVGFFFLAVALASLGFVVFYFRTFNGVPDYFFPYYPVIFFLAAVGGRNLVLALRRRPLVEIAGAAALLGLVAYLTAYQPMLRQQALFPQFADYPGLVAVTNELLARSDARRGIAYAYVSRDDGQQENLDGHVGRDRPLWDLLDAETAPPSWRPTYRAANCSDEPPDDPRALRCLRGAAVQWAGEGYRAVLVSYLAVDCDRYAAFLSRTGMAEARVNAALERAGWRQVRSAPATLTGRVRGVCAVRLYSRDAPARGYRDLPPVSRTFEPRDDAGAPR